MTIDPRSVWCYLRGVRGLIFGYVICGLAACAETPSDYRDAPRSFDDSTSEAPVCDGDCASDPSTDALFASPLADQMQAQEVFVDTVHRHGDDTVTVPLLFYAPDHPVAAVILFAGSNGLLELSSAGVGEGAKNFVVRTRKLYAAENMCTVLVDAPSDHPNGLGNGYRTGATEAKDIAPVIAYVQQHCAGVPIWLVGTSRGTISIANVAARLSDGIAGLILTSSITVDPDAGTSKPEMATLYDVPLHTIALPIQLMHHHDDACPASPFGGGGHDKFTGVDNLMNHFTSAAPTALDPVSASIAGGSDSPCGPVSYHGYWQLDDDADVVPAIVQFIDPS
jgi:poly(3-hydroxybutyrate) depolymerase